MKQKIFISYSSIDLSVAQTFHTILSGAGFDIFLAKENIQISDDWTKEIEEAINTFDYFLVLLSEHSNESEMVREEVRRARKRYNNLPVESRPGIFVVRLNLPFSRQLNYDIDSYLNTFQQILCDDSHDTEVIVNEIIHKITTKDHEKRAAHPVAPLSLPGQVLSKDNQFYIERDGESLFRRNILSNGPILLKIKAPRYYGKTSLLCRISGAAQDNSHIVALNFKLLESRQLENIEILLKTICYEIQDTLNISDYPEIWVNQLLSTPRKCDKIMEKMLTHADRPVVLALDQVDELFEHDAVSNAFFGLIRSWTEKQNSSAFDKLRMVISYSSDAALAIMDPRQSPLNTGHDFRLESFTKEEFEELVRRHGVNLTNIGKLYELLGGHPHLTMKALYAIAQKSDRDKQAKVLKEILENGVELFDDHLKMIYWQIRRKEEYVAFIRKLMQNNRPSPSDYDVFSRLQSAGIIIGELNNCTFHNRLYRDFFIDTLAN